MIPSREPLASGWRVSVVIPVKDDAVMLERCLAALATQTQPADEIVVVDNASSDDSADVARAAGAVVVRCDARGIPAAASRGYDAASGDVVLRLDADCLPRHDWIEHMVQALAADPRAAAVSGGARFVDGPPRLRAPLAAVYLGAYVALATSALGHPPVFGSNMAMRREAWLAASAHVHRHDPELHDDLDLAFHLGERARIRWTTGEQMGMSMRPFGAGRGFGRRIVRGLRTIAVHWPADFPPLRWARRAVAALEDASVSARLARREGRT
ncbi:MULTISPECIES: glycosyltransferase family 2 protein [unclassified Agrococcus]|uniref:glycosyltransferase family 2 protein n=1 Tax=unclassified Agrococcus TaxID=2615065 RepID=UPI0036122854